MSDVKVVEGVPEFIERPGYDALWEWFSLSYAPFCVMPRVMMHAMPDDWQAKMAALMVEWDDHWDQEDIGFDTCHVTVKKNRKFVKMPKWLTNYRYPDLDELERIRAKNVLLNNTKI